jgi:hypothetical protein
VSANENNLFATETRLRLVDALADSERTENLSYPISSHRTSKKNPEGLRGLSDCHAKGLGGVRRVFHWRVQYSHENPNSRSEARCAGLDEAAETNEVRDEFKFPLRAHTRRIFRKLEKLGYGEDKHIRLYDEGRKRHYFFVAGKTYPKPKKADPRKAKAETSVKA